MNERRSEWATFAVLGVAFTVAWVWVCWMGRQVVEVFS